MHISLFSQDICLSPTVKVGLAVSKLWRACITAEGSIYLENLIDLL